MPLPASASAPAPLPLAEKDAERPRPRRRPKNQLEVDFDAAFASKQALREKQIQQNYRPVIGIHKWFARRPGTLFRCLLLSEFGSGPLANGFEQGHRLSGTIADPFMGGGTTLYEASRLGLSVIGNDINPMSHWLIERAFAQVDRAALAAAANEVVGRVEENLGHLYKTTCLSCSGLADAKYFLWVKTAVCPSCDSTFDVFPSRLLAKAERHPYFVVACAGCGELNEYDHQPKATNPAECRSCKSPVSVEGNSRRGTAQCPHCSHRCSFPGQTTTPPVHRLWAIEYNCAPCYSTVKGRQFKRPDADDLERAQDSERLLAASAVEQYIPDERIPDGDETRRLHRWGYGRFREMFNPRQLLFLATLVGELKALPDGEVRRALLTVLSDILRYNNMLGRYDTYALKCQDIFSVHGFPVGLVQCENNVLGIPGVGSGGFRHFVEKYLRAKEYCERPFETTFSGKRKQLVYPRGEFIGASSKKSVSLTCGPSQDVDLQGIELDGVFTDPPYFANVQYSELIDFCYVWLRRAGEGGTNFAGQSTRSSSEASGNTTAGRGLVEFTEALSLVYRRFCGALKADAPLVFTYHHNNPLAYVPLIVAVLDAGMVSVAVLPAAAEMSASTHIANTVSSILDSVFVCRRRGSTRQSSLGLLPKAGALKAALLRDASAMKEAGVAVSEGDLRCLLAGHLAHTAIGALASSWQAEEQIDVRMNIAESALSKVLGGIELESVVREVLPRVAKSVKPGDPLDAASI